MTAIQRVALITGGSSGFGREIALTLSREGYEVVAAFRGSRGGFASDAAELVAASADVGGVRCEQLDVTDERSIARAVAAVIKSHGRIDVLVNAAGYGLLGPMECTTIAQIWALFDTNVFGTMRVCKAVVPLMRAQGSGRVVNFSSDVGLRANFFQSAYAASKFAVDGYSQSLRLELRSFGIDVALVCPGWYDTAFGKSAVTTFDTGDASPAYTALVQKWNEGVARVEGPREDLSEVARSVQSLLSKREPSYRNPVGWNRDRMINVRDDEIDRFQEHLLDYYQMSQPTNNDSVKGSVQ